MAPLAARSAFRAVRLLRPAAPRATRAASSAATTSDSQKDDENVRERVFKKGATRDPELYILATVMTGAFGLAGYYFARKPTSSSSEQMVSMVENSEPWQTGRSGKYQYHPGGDRSRAPKDAPSALHSVIIPDVNLPAELHERFNKYDKEEFDDY